jgi:methionyl-tRNA formyltransferase
MSRPLRVHVVTSEDPFYLPVFFREFFAHLPRGPVVVTGVDLTPPLNQTRPTSLARKLYRFYGPVDFTRLTLRYAASKSKDALLPSTWPGTVRRIAALHGVPSSVVPSVNAEGYVERLRGLDLDLLVSVAASQIFKDRLLSVPRLDAVNVHTGPLPQYRGMMPVFWQMRDGRSSIGITIHTMTTRIDLGEIVLARSVPLDGLRALDGVTREMKRHGAHALLELLSRYVEGTVTRVPMDAAGGAYRSFPTAPDAVALRQRGYRLL